MIDILKVVVFGGLFAVPFLTLYVENEFFFPYITGKNFWFRIIVDVAFAAWLILAIADARYRPRFSWLLASFGGLLVVMFFANIFGVHPQSSFFSNFERMDGYITLLHVFLYFVVLGATLTTRSLWQYYLHTSLVVAFFVTLYGLAQAGGMIDSYRGDRIDSWLGNPTYLAIYLLFHIFITFWLFVETKVGPRRVIYGLLALMFMWALSETGTRGTVIGLGTGVVAMAAYIGIFGARFREFRKYAIGSLILLLVVCGALMAARDTAFVQENNNLARIANIDLGRDLTVRMTIWGLAWDAVQEQPLLGYGQSNFNYVFNEHYDPRLYGQEQWFDRVHNIFFDWLITGGFLGLFAYLSIFVAAAYYLFWLPLVRNDERFTVIERAVMIGMLVGYFTHNLVVFDNIVSYIFFGMLLALLHNRVAVPITSLQRLKVAPMVVSQVVAPVVLVAVGAVIYFVHVPSMQAAAAIINAMQAPSALAQEEIFRETLAKNTFARQEITEQFVQRAMEIARSENVPEADRNLYLASAEAALQELITFKPGDARIHVFAGLFYRNLGRYPEAAEQLAIARSLSPNKQAIIIQQGFVALASGNNEVAYDFFKTAYELEPANLEAREYYAAALFYTNRGGEVAALMDSEEVRIRFAESDFLISAANGAGATNLLIELFGIRTSIASTSAQNWASLAFLQYQSGDVNAATATLAEAATVLPSFASTASCISANIVAGLDPQLGCE